MRVNAIELINVLIVGLSLFAMWRRRDVVTLLLLLCTYGTLHFSFAAIALTQHESSDLMVALHNYGGGLLATLAERSVASAYVIAALCCCLLTGLVMRFQIFPVWLFISVTLSLCLAYWRRATVRNTILDEKLCVH